MENATGIEEGLSRFAPITLEEMDGVALQHRMDTKYMFGEAMLLPVLMELLPDYRILEVNGRRASHYRSLYFDTPGRRDFLDHHNGRSFRSKVRFREYVGSGSCFLEVKRKNGRGGTEKVRIAVPGIPATLDPGHQAFIAGATGRDGALEPVMWNDFMRVTLVHRVRQERLTIDRDLRFSTPDGERTLHGLCVAELKEGKADRNSPFARAMRSRRIPPSGMSKYCVGLLLLGVAPKYNTFKETLLTIDRLRRSGLSGRQAA